MFDNLVSRFKMLARQTYSLVFSFILLSLAHAGRIKRMESSIIEVNGKLGMYLVRHFLVNKCITYIFLINLNYQLTEHSIPMLHYI